jgi:signal recognition particle GTPase
MFTFKFTSMFKSLTLFLCYRGPISKIASMIPGLPQEMLEGSDEEGGNRMKRMIFITDSMTAGELDSDGSLFIDMASDEKWRSFCVNTG